MTLCLGIRFGDAILMAADAAVTKEGRPKNTFSHFDQLQDRDGMSVEESALKIIPISKTAVMAVAGVVAHLRPCVEFFLTYASEYSIPDLLSRFLLNRPWPENADCEFLLGYCHNDELRLVRWSSRSPNLQEVEVDHGAEIGFFELERTDPEMALVRRLKNQRASDRSS